MIFDSKITLKVNFYAHYSISTMQTIQDLGSRNKFNLKSFKLQVNGMSKLIRRCIFN